MAISGIFRGCCVQADDDQAKTPNTSATTSLVSPTLIPVSCTEFSYNTGARPARNLHHITRCR